MKHVVLLLLNVKLKVLSEYECSQVIIKAGERLGDKELLEKE